MDVRRGPRKFGVAVAYLALAVILLVASAGAAYYIAIGGNRTNQQTGNESIASTNCGNPPGSQSNQGGVGSSPCVSASTSSALIILSSGPLTMSNVNLVSICYVSYCGNFPIMSLSFELINTSQTNGTIVSLNLGCEACGIGGGANNEGYNLPARLGGYDNESMYKCSLAGPEFNNVPPGDTSYQVVCYGPGSAPTTYPYQFVVMTCIPSNLSSAGLCNQSTTTLELSINAAPYGSHLIPSRHSPDSLTGPAEELPYLTLGFTACCGS